MNIRDAEFMVVVGAADTVKFTAGNHMATLERVVYSEYGSRTLKICEYDFWDGALIPGENYEEGDERYILDVVEKMKVFLGDVVTTPANIENPTLEDVRRRIVTVERIKAYEEHARDVLIDYCGKYDRTNDDYYIDSYLEHVNTLPAIERELERLNNQKKEMEAK